jgi:hypothetical protein
MAYGIPKDIDAELVRCAADNGRIRLDYLRDLWRRGYDCGYDKGWADGLDENHGDPRVEQIEAGFRAIHEATGGDYSREDHIVLGALQAAREFAVRLARIEGNSR